MQAHREVLDDPLSYGEIDAAGLLEQRRMEDATHNAMLADAMARSLRGALDRMVRPLARTARQFLDQRCWIPIGYARVGDHARERLGRTGRWLRDMAALDTALRRLPGLSAALTGEDGKRPIGRVAATFVGKVASPESVSAWIDLARSMTVRALKDHVKRARRRGSEWPDRATAKKDGASGDASTNDDGTEANDTPDADDPESDRCRLRVPMPVPVRVAFQEAAGLYRAVSGSEASASSFAEALVAEACAGPRPPDVDVAAPAVRGHLAEVEVRLAKRTNHWANLDREVPRFPSLAVAVSCLQRLNDVSTRAGHGDSCELDGQLRELISLEDEIEKALARLLLEMSEQRSWRVLGFGGVGHYAEERLRLSRSSASDRVRLGRVLRRFPWLRESYESGAVTAEAARLVAGALGRGSVSLDLERRWIERAERATVKRLRDETRELRRRQAVGISSVTCEPLDDAAWYASLARAPGEFRERVRDLGLRAAGHPETGTCFDLTLPEDLAERFLAAVESSRTHLAAVAGHGVDAEVDPVTGAAPSLVVARMFSARRLPLPAWVGLLAMLEDFVDTWDDPEGAPKRRSDAVYIRDGWQCSAPGCTSRSNLEDHHVAYRSRGGSDDMSNRISVCRFHHQWGEHGTIVSCRGTAPLGIEWRLGSRRVTRYRNELWIGGDRVRESPIPTSRGWVVPSGHARHERQSAALA